MQLVPDWSPNIHPMIVHFPIVLLIAAVLLDVSGLFLNRFNWLKKSAFVLYAIGTIVIIITFFTGRSAADGLDIPAKVISSVNDHADWAETTMWFFIVYSVVRLTIGIWFKSLKKIIVIPFVLAGLLGIYFLYQTADHGAKLVFGYGLGTGNIIKLVDETKGITIEDRISDSTFTTRDDGSWKLIADATIIKALSSMFKWVEGSLNELSPMYDRNESALMFHQIKEAMFVYDNKIKSVQVTAKINIDDLKGGFELVHHFIDKNNYDFLGLKNGEISLSRKSNGEIKIFEKDSYTNKGWIEIKVVSDGTHFRGYVNNKLIVHGHGDKPEPGSVGIKLSGTGSFSIKLINVESLKK